MLKDSVEMIGLAMEVGLSPDDFYMPSHQTICEELFKVYDSGQAVDLVEFTQSLLDRGLLDKVGGPSAIADLWSYAPHNGSFDRHIQTVKDKSVLRRLVAVANDVIQNAIENPDDATSAMELAESSIMAVRERSVKKQCRTITDDLRDIYNLIANPLQSGKDGIKTGYDKIDRMLNGGMSPGELIVIAARPSVGKSALMMNIVRHVGITNKIPCGVFSLEMPQKQLLQRVVSDVASFDFRPLHDGLTPTKQEMVKIARCFQQIKDSPIFIDDTPAITISNLRAMARRWKMKHGIKFIAIDYLQLMKSRSKQAEFSREREIAEISAGLKSLAKELEVPIVVLAQLNRQVENRTGKAKGRPRMSDLRESGAIEQDADIIGLLSRDAYSCDTEEEKTLAGNGALLDIAKNRNGETGFAHMEFLPAFTKFIPADPPAYKPFQPKANHGNF